MSTLQEIYDTIVSDDSQKRAFVEAMRAGEARGFLREHGFDVTEEEHEEYLGGRTKQVGPLEVSDDELKEVAGALKSAAMDCGGKSYVCSDPYIRNCC